MTTPTPPPTLNESDLRAIDSFTDRVKHLYDTQPALRGYLLAGALKVIPLDIAFGTGLADYVEAVDRAGFTMVLNEDGKMELRPKTEP